MFDFIPACADGVHGGQVVFQSLIICVVWYLNIRFFYELDLHLKYPPMMKLRQLHQCKQPMWYTFLYQSPTRVIQMR